MTAVDERHRSRAPKSSAATPRRPARPPSPTGAGWSSRPTSAERLDVLLLGALCCAALYGFRSSYGGSRYLIAGLVGLVLGTAIGLVSARRRDPAVVVVAVTTLAFFVFGAAAVPDDALFGVVPSPASVVALVDGAIQGWAKLLTTVPPVGASGALVTIPYLCGLLAGVLSITVARRSRAHLLAIVVPIAVLALSILFGTAEPASLLIQGALFVTVGIAWLSLRVRLDRAAGEQILPRSIGATLMLVAIGAGSFVIGPHMPLAESRPRTVLRDRADPPFDPREYPSPLVSFRRYVDTADTGWATTKLLSVDGLPAGVRLRLATMSSYDGVSFNVASSLDPDDHFSRVGSELVAAGAGERHRIHVTVHGYSNVWVPDVGELVSIEFGGPRAAELEEDFRYNLHTGTGALLTPLKEGDSYTVDVVVRDDPPISAIDEPVGSSPLSDVVPIEQVSTLAAERAAGASTVAEKVASVASTLTGDGYYFSHGLDEGGRARAGHGAKRLTEMTRQNGAAVGDEEQYAALAALMSNSLGVPARVVMGFAPDSSDGSRIDIDGDDVSAWIEVEFADRGWVAVTDFVPDDDDPPPPAPEPEPEDSQLTPPPPPVVIPPANSDDVQPDAVEDPDETDDAADSGGVPRIVYVAGAAFLAPAVAIGAATALVAGLKAGRRRRRRSSGSPSTRIASGWAEMTDLAMDLGSPLPTRATRREAAGLLGTSDAVALAQQADGTIFGPGDIGEDAVGSFWTSVERTRRSLLGELSLFGRWKATVNLSSLRRVTLRR